MNIATLRRAPRPAEPSTEQTRSSTDLRADLVHLDADRAAAADRLSELEAGRDAVLLTDDDAKAEAHDAEMQRVRRAIERADLKRPGIVAAVEAAVAREEANAFARRQAEASAAVEAVIARLAKEYEAPPRSSPPFWRTGSARPNSPKPPRSPARMPEFASVHRRWSRLPVKTRSSSTSTNRVGTPTSPIRRVPIRRACPRAGSSDAPASVRRGTTRASISAPSRVERICRPRGSTRMRRGPAAISR